MNACADGTHHRKPIRHTQPISRANTCVMPHDPQRFLTITSLSLLSLSLTHYVWYMDWMHGTPFIRIYPVWNGTQKKVKASTVQVSKTIKYHCCSTVFALFWILLFTLWFFCFRWLLQFVGINDLSTVFTECINVKFNNQINILTLKDFKFFVNLIFRWSLYPVYDSPSKKQR